ncbi:hypothetical protein FIV00_07490 [Labrenzia sp. THAF82]|uniref:DUF3305 domain-containing protein n=1 Tax=Labrenzia sp. THAF82 TaxID=2587861 RepID=UPI0012A881D6|nr:DUF3305 domain-containing protein [Labrenzia sp. THAF82]QFT30310.1 hypothetical protein FIV00_07490 [Labrenzia sp. THAF82]
MTAEKTQTMPVGVVVRRLPGVTRWQKWSWRPVSLLPGAGPADWKVLRQEGEAVEYHAATLPLELHRADTEAYLTALSDKVPSVYVVLRPADEVERDLPLDVMLVTASAYEGQDYADSSEVMVEKLPMPEGLVAWIRDFVKIHHEEEIFIKRKRDKKRIDLQEDGVGDPRIRQLSDVYRAPLRKPKDTLQ